MLSTKADSIIKSLPDLSFYDLSKIIIEANTQRDLKCEDDKIQLRNSIITQRDTTRRLDWVRNWVQILY